jgi:GNAT superfamily N-acetyltransferase
VQGHLALVRGVEDEQLVRATGRPAAELVAVSRLFVRPAAQGRGLGEQLLRTATEHAVRDGARLVLEVVAEDRSAALRLYARLGWQQVGQRTAGWTTPDGTRPRLVLLRWVPDA